MATRLLKPLKVLAALIGFGAVAAVLFAFLPGESYNYIWPSIDTVYAAGFSERAFSQVTTGMQASAVLQLLGPPLDKQLRTNDEETWYYSRDGRCSWGDFAWLARTITLREGRVISVEKRVYYD